MVEVSHCPFLKLNVKQESCDCQFLLSLVGLARLGIEPESTVSVADALSTSTRRLNAQRMFWVLQLPKEIGISNKNNRLIPYHCIFINHIVTDSEMSTNNILL